MGRHVRLELLRNRVAKRQQTVRSTVIEHAQGTLK
jgi:hypothetical protein